MSTHETGFSEEQRKYLEPWLDVFQEAVFEFENRGLGLTVLIENLNAIPAGDFHPNMEEGEQSHKNNVIPLSRVKPAVEKGEGDNELP